MSLAAAVRDAGIDAGLDAVGIAPATAFTGTRRILEQRKRDGLHGGMHFTYGDPARSTDPQRLLPGGTARALVVGARSYRRADPPPPPDTGVAARVARYSWRDHYEPLRAALHAAAEPLRAAGFHAVVVADDNGLVDREAAVRAGLGWYGKNANVLLPGQGSWFVLGSVVTDAPLPAADDTVPDGCGPCTRCLPACPTGALVAPGVLDARRCLAWLVEAPGVFPREHRVALGDRLYGCDDCQDACPLNRTADRHSPPPTAEYDAEPWVDALEVLRLDDDALLHRFGRWYIPRRQPRHLRRNALVVLGNVGTPGDPRVRTAVRDALTHSDPLVRAHAVWAAQRLGYRDLLAAIAATEEDLTVRAELAAAS